MSFRVRVLSQVQKQFLGWKTDKWTRLGRANSIKERSLKDTGAMVCLVGMETIKAMALQVDLLAKTLTVIKGVKGSRLTVLGASVVEISVGDKKSHQILYVARETKRLILSRTCLEQLGMVLGDLGAKDTCGCRARSEVPALPT